MLLQSVSETELHTHPGCQTDPEITAPAAPERHLEVETHLKWPLAPARKVIETRDETQAFISSEPTLRIL